MNLAKLIFITTFHLQNNELDFFSSIQEPDVAVVQNTYHIRICLFDLS